MGKNTSIRVFLDSSGKITKIPVPERTKLPLLRYLAGKFEADRDYTEKEVNAIIGAWHTFNDFFILRRLLVDYGLLGRVPNGSRYWVIPTPDNNEPKDSENDLSIL